MHPAFDVPRRGNVLEFRTGVPVDDQFLSPKQGRFSAVLGKVLVANGGTTVNFHVRNTDLSFVSKTWYVSAAMGCIDSDGVNIYTSSGAAGVGIRVWPLNFVSSANYLFGNGSFRMINASGDPLYLYVTSNNATDGHGVRMVKKATMSVVASMLATGTGDNQFTNPLGVFFVSATSKLYICEATRIVELNVTRTDGAEALTWSTSYPIAANDLYFDGTNWFVQSSTQTIKYDSSFTDGTKVAVACVGYSITGIPDQGDGYGATLCIVNNSGSCLYRRKCSDLSLIITVGSAGDGSSSIVDPQVTGPTGVWQDDIGGQYSVASGANISKNGFSGDFFTGAGPHRMVFKPTGGKTLADITAIDFNADAIKGRIKNLNKLINCASTKLQTQPELVLNLGELSPKHTVVWAYGCGAGIYGSIRHMTSITDLKLRENGASVAQVDAWVEDLWALRDILVTPSINMNGSNSAPTGTYQEAETPSTPKEKIHSLINDYMWTFVFTA